MKPIILLFLLACSSAPTETTTSADTRQAADPNDLANYSTRCHLEKTDQIIWCSKGNEYVCGRTTQKLPCGDPNAVCPSRGSYCVTPSGGFGLAE